jgi:osmotically inducible protein OsmC
LHPPWSICSSGRALVSNAAFAARNAHEEFSMSVSNASAEWNGTPQAGQGRMKPAHGSELPFSVATRFEGREGSNPEELIGAALAGCFSMALAHALEQEGMKPEHIETKAAVSIVHEEVGYNISKIELHTQARVPNADPTKFDYVARSAKETCPVAKALLGTTVTLHAQLE